MKQTKRTKNEKMLLVACMFALKKLNEMTTAKFSIGGDKEIRDVLEYVIKEVK